MQNLLVLDKRGRKERKKGKYFFKFFFISYFLVCVNSCRPYEVSFYIGTIVPFVLIYIFNWTLFIIIIASLTYRSCKSQYVQPRNNPKMTKLRQQLKAAITLSFLFGLSWGLGIPASTKIFGFTPPETMRKILEFAFIGLSAFQGFAIFVLQCFNSSDAKTAWRSLYNSTFGRTSVIGKLTISSSSNTNNSNSTKSDNRLLKDTSTKIDSNGNHDSAIPVIVIEGPEATNSSRSGSELETCFHSDDDETTAGTVIDNECTQFSVESLLSLDSHHNNGVNNPILFEDGSTVVTNFECIESYKHT